MLLSHDKFSSHSKKPTSVTEKVYLSITVVAARDLVALDRNGSSDPCVTVSVGKRLAKSSKAKHKTRRMKNTLDPLWNKKMVVKSKDPKHESIYFQVWDWNRIASTKPLGETAVPVARVLENGKIDEWITLENIKQGELHVIIVPETEKPKRRRTNSKTKDDDTTESTHDGDDSESETEHEESSMDTEPDEKDKAAAQATPTPLGGVGSNSTTTLIAQSAAQIKNSNASKKWTGSLSEDSFSAAPTKGKEPQLLSHSKKADTLDTQSLKKARNSSKRKIEPLTKDKGRHEQPPAATPENLAEHKDTQSLVPIAILPAPSLSTSKAVTIELPKEKKEEEKERAKEREKEGPIRKSTRRLGATGRFETAFQIYVTVIEAENLAGVDKSGTSDPYVTVSVDKKVDDPKKAEFKTQHILKTLNPVWSQEFVVASARPDVDSIHVQVWDWNRLMKHAPLGDVEIPAKKLTEEGEIDEWFTLENTTTGKIHLKLSSAPISSLAEADDTASQTVDVNHITLKLRIVEADHLHAHMETRLAPYATVTLGKLVKKPQKALFKTHVAENTHKPYWDQEFEIAHIDIKRLAQPNVYIQVWHSSLLRADQKLGYTVLPILRMVKNKQQHDEWVQLDGARKGRIHVTYSYAPSDESTVDVEQAAAPEPENAPDPIAQPLTLIERIEDNDVVRRMLPYVPLFLAVVVCYMMGACGVSKVWLILVGLAIYQLDRRKRKDEFKTRYAKMQLHRKNMIVKHETETAEWLNVFLRKVWPRFTPYFASVIKEQLHASLKDLLEETKPRVVDEISIESVSFKESEIPLEILCVTAANYPYFQLDLAVEYHSAIRVVANIAASAKLTTINLPIAIKDVFIKGTLRLNFHVSDEFPFISELDIAFKTKPAIGLRIQPLYTVNLLDVPLLHDWIFKALSAAIKQAMVLPQRLVVDVGYLATGQHVSTSHNVVVTSRKSLGQKKQNKERKLAALLDLNSVLRGIRSKIPGAAVVPHKPTGRRLATLKLVKIKARDLHPVDRNGKSDPYVILRTGGRVKKTDVLRKTLNPDWEFTTEFPVFTDSSRLMDVLVMDWNMTKKHQFLGTGVLDFSNMATEDQSHTYSVKLQGVASGKVVIELVMYKEEEEEAPLKLHDKLPLSDMAAEAIMSSNYALPAVPKKT